MQGQSSTVGSFAAGNAPRMVHLAHGGAHRTDWAQSGEVAQAHLAQGAHAAQVRVQLVGVHSAQVVVAVTYQLVVVVIVVVVDVDVVVVQFVVVIQVKIRVESIIVYGSKKRIVVY